MLILKDLYKIDVFRFDIEHSHNMVDLQISNAISWDSMNIRATKEELKGLADFIYSMIDEIKDN